MRRIERIKLWGLITVSLLVILAAGYASYLYYNKEKSRVAEEKRIECIANIASHYAQTVITTNEAKAYNSEYGEIGRVAKGEYLDLGEMTIDENTKYFYAKDLDIYVEYVNVLPEERKEDIGKYRYNWYVPFNEDVVIDGNANLYDMEEKIVYEIDKKIKADILIKDDDKYYFVFNGKLLYVNKGENVTTISEKNLGVATRNNVRTLAYHFITNEKTGNVTITHTVAQFDEQMKYLKDNNYFTMSVYDLELFLDGKINIPKNSVVITIDDGYYLDNAISVLEKYELLATAFVITADADIKSMKSDYLDLQSHTNAMHEPGVCPGGNQGGAILCSDSNIILTDLSLSSEKLGGAIAIAYPLYDYNQRAIGLVKEAGFRLGFAGRAGKQGVSTVGTNKFIIPRYTLWNTHTMNEFKSLVK